MTFLQSTFSNFSRKTARFLAAAACAGGLLSASLPAHAGPLTGTYTLSPSQIETGFSVRVLGRGPVTGAFTNVSGKMILNQNRPEKSRVEVTVDLSSVTTNNNKVTGFLKSSAMFDVAKHPIAKFQSTRVRITGQNTAEVDGVLVMRGKQKRTTLSVTINPNSKGRVAFEVSGAFFRSLYGMDAGLPIYADRVNLNIKGTGRRS